MSNPDVTCCFFGHRKIEAAEKLTEKLTWEIENLIINYGVVRFLFGSKSEFDTLCLGAVTRLKEKYPQIKRVYVRAEYKHITNDYKAYLLQSYDETYYPEKISNSGRACYVERNCEMIDRSKFCVVYYDENYKPPKRKNSAKLPEHQPKSGTKIAYDYAVKKKKIIVNMHFENLPE